MSHISRTAKLLPFGGLLAIALVFAGCDREQIKVQEVPKDADPAPAPMTAAVSEPAAMPANPHAGMDMGGGAGQPQVKWTLPDGWQEKPLSEMRAGSIDAKGKDGQSADIAIIPLPSGGPQMELANLNMWRSELQLSPVQTAESDSVTVGPAQGKLFDIGDDKTPGRILVAVLDRNGVSWYFKMRGTDSVVQELKPAFLQFLKSISFEAAPAADVAMSNPHASMGADPMSPSEAAPVSAPGLPDGWKEIPNPPMLLAKYVIQGSGDAKADVNISALAGTGGEFLMMNVNRWRGQLGLSPLSEEDFSKNARTMDLAGGKATLVDLTGTDKAGKSSRLIGIIAPQAGQTWFYKLMGDPQIVERQKDAFTKFIQTAKFSNAP